MTAHAIRRLAALALLLGLALAAAAPPSASARPAALVAPAVQRALSATAAADDLDVIVELRRQVGLPSAPAAGRAARLATAVRALRALADADQRDVLALLARRRAEGLVIRVRPFWIFNGLEVVARPAVVRELAARPDVAAVRPNATVEAPAAPTGATGAEWNVARDNAPALWDLGYRGRGVVVASMDTGVDVTHPDLASRWRGGKDSWYDPNNQHPASPVDVSGHGTWTMGAMVGGDAGGTAIGIAPDATWIAVKIFNDRGVATTAGIHAGFQWLLDPDHDPSTPDAPQVVLDAWTFANGGCDLTFAPDLRSLRAAGILPVFAAGNGGPLGATSYSPANNPDAFAVGATGPDDLVDAGSSRGPSACDGSRWPQLTAPGVNVLTTDLFGMYATVTGTSIAAPQAAGALALLLGAFPGADADRQAAALQRGAVDAGAPGPDNDYGAGRLDVLGAYTWLSTAPDFSVAASPATATAPAGATTTFTVDVRAINGFAGDVALSLSGLPSGQATWSFAPATVTGGAGTAQLTLTTSASLAPGTYSLTATGTSGALVHTAKVALTVTAPPDFGLSVTPSSATATAGLSASATVSVSSLRGFAGSVAVSASGLPSGATATFSRTPVTAPGSSTLTIRTTRTATRGTFSIIIRGTSGTLVHQATLTLTIRT